MHVPVEPGMVQQLRWLIRVLLDWISVNRPIVRLMFDAVADWSTGRVYSGLEPRLLRRLLRRDLEH